MQRPQFWKKFLIISKVIWLSCLTTYMSFIGPISPKHLSSAERHIQPLCCLTDKDMSEINAIRNAWPNAKLQLCFWHAIKAVKTRLANSEKSTAFNPRASIEEFPELIDPYFTPALATEPTTKKFCQKEFRERA